MPLCQDRACTGYGAGVPCAVCEARPERPLLCCYPEPAIIARGPLYPEGARSYPYPTPSWMGEHRDLAARGDRRLCQTVVMAYEPGPNREGPRRIPALCLHLGRKDHTGIEGKLCNRHHRFAAASARGVGTYWIRGGKLWAPGTLQNGSAQTFLEQARQEERSTWEALEAGWHALYCRVAGERDAYKRALDEANLALRARVGRRAGRRG